MIQREFLDWTTPGLAAAARWLLDHRASIDDLTCSYDLRSSLCVVPGRRAARLLTRTLVELAATDGRPLSPPQILTPGPLVDQLLRLDASVASTFEQQLAWNAALGAANDLFIAPLLPHGAQSESAHLGLADHLQRMHAELAGARTDAEALAQIADSLDLSGEAERWRVILDLRREYIARLRQHDLDDPHAARERALTRDVAATDATIVLVGVADLNALQREVLQRSGAPIIALIQAPLERADDFDAFGCVEVERWQTPRLDVTDEQIIVADQPQDQAYAALRAIAGFDGAFAADEITIGLGDPELAGPLERAGDWLDLELRAADGRPLPRTAPYRLLDAIANWLEEPRFEHMAALVRHHDVERFLWQQRQSSRTDTGIANWLSVLDEYFSRHLAREFIGPWLQEDDRATTMKWIHATIVTKLLKELRGNAKPAGAWATGILGVLRRVYGRRPLLSDDEPDRLVAGACLALRDVLLELRDARADLQPRIAASEAIRLVLHRASDAMVPRPGSGEHVEMLGWLELTLDPAPALVVVGMNDGSVPAAVRGDAFLPNGMRRRAGLLDNSRRFARDAFAMSILLHSRRAVFVGGRRDNDRMPLAPSRLLLAGDPEGLPERVNRLCGGTPAEGWPLPLGAPPTPSRSGFKIPAAPPAPELTSMRVTDFYAYLHCPYRYALKRIERLKSVTDEALEMDALHFGVLAHDILDEWAKDEDLRDEVDPARLREFLRDTMNQLAGAKFGARFRSSVHIQLARLGLRLDRFALNQAALRDAGWRVKLREVELPEHASLTMGSDDAVQLRGRIDRVDQHEKSGHWRIIDYKTSEQAKAPSAKNPNKYGEWSDLQLPLYHSCAELLGCDGPVEVGYITLSKSARDVGWRPGKWDDAALRDGVDAAREVVRRIREGDFEMKPLRAEWDEFQRICQSFVRRSGAVREGGDDG